MKQLEFSILLDYYGGLLTEKQREVIWLYYNEDMSLTEISELSGVTRQGVRDSIKRGEAVLSEMEEKLGFAHRDAELREGLETIVSLSRGGGEETARIRRIAQGLSELL